jgi:hypothetical protein
VAAFEKRYAEEERVGVHPFLLSLTLHNDDDDIDDDDYAFAPAASDARRTCLIAPF